MGNFLSYVLDPWDLTRQRAQIKNEKDANMARSKSLQDALDQKTKELNSTLSNEEAVTTNGRVLDPTATKKQTIKSLNIPLNTNTNGTGLNV